jgi:hypothetical protein
MTIFSDIYRHQQKHHWLFRPGLTLLLLMLCAGTASAKWDHTKVLGASECGECHEEAVDVWKKTKHQKNYKALSKNKDAKAIAKKMGVKSIKKPVALCSSCHYTVGNKNGKKKIVAGVSCESCHSPSKAWINVHNDYGGKGVNKKQESASHKKGRYAKLEQLGMIRPDNIYGWAKNCLSCHIVANEKLVNTGGHAAGSDFKLSKRSQGKVRHYEKASVDELRFLNLVSYATELELSLNALATASGGKYAAEMKKRAGSALSNLKKANDSTPNQYAKKIIGLAGSAGIKAGNRALKSVASNIAVNTMRMVQAQTGYKYSASKLKATPLAKPKAKAKPKATPKSVAKPKPKPKAKPVARPKPATKPAARTVTKTPATKAVAVDAPLPTLQPEDAGGKLFAAFKLVTPQNAALCQTYTPWVLGEKTLDDSSYLANDGCLAVKVKPARTAQLYLFTESGNGALTQLLPNQCGALNMSFNALSAGKTSTFPKTANQSAAVIQLHELPGVFKVYGVLTDNAQANNDMLRLGNQVASICDEQGKTNNTAAGFINMLDVIKQNSAGHMDWQVKSFRR